MKPRQFLLALQFLSRYPVSLGPRPLSARDFGACTRYFPLVGLLLGLDLWVLRWLFHVAGLLERWPLAAAGLLLLFWAWSCDSLHLDGLADTVDGLASGKRGKAMLAVMHDSRSGAFGSQAVALVLVLKLCFLASLGPGLWWALPLPLISSRFFASLCCQSRPYIGQRKSLSAGFITGTRRPDALWALAWALASVALLAGLGLAWGACTPAQAAAALALCSASVGLAWALTTLPRQRLGGISGDVIGYGMQACELGAAFGLLFIRA